MARHDGFNHLRLAAAGMIKARPTSGSASSGMKMVCELARFVGVEAASESSVRLTTPTDVTVTVKQKKEPEGTVISAPGENGDVVRPDPTASVVSVWATVVIEEQVLEEL